VRHERTTEIIPEFFAPAVCQERLFDMRQQFDYQGVAGRLLSSSYAPTDGDPNYEPMMRELQQIFRTHQKADAVAFEYKTRVFYGRLSS
jgi:hypothetical protein